MTQHHSGPTAYPDVNAVLAEFRASIQAILGSRFVGMYLYGSLALGGFDPHGSDIDFLVATAGELPGDLFDALSEMHRGFDAGGSPWAGRVEAAYIPAHVLRDGHSGKTRYPQIEKGEKLALAPLEVGWPFQFHSLREHRLVIAGPDPRQLIAPVERAAMHEAAAAIVGDWLDCHVAIPNGWPGCVTGAGRPL
jgi:hypothetical protein